VQEKRDRRFGGSPPIRVVQQSLNIGVVSQALF
jgi:hypothetical protein